MLPYDCLIEILSYLKLNKLKQLKYLTKNFSKVVETVIKSYSNKKIGYSLRYCISIDNLAWFIDLQKYALPHNFFYLLRYACRLNNEVFVNHLLLLNIPGHFIRKCIIDMIKLHQQYKNVKLLSIIYKMYFYLLTNDVKEASLIPHDFFHYFYKREYIKLYDEFGDRWMIFEMDN